MKRKIILVVLPLLLMLIDGCSKEENDSQEKNGTIYGRVTDLVTAESIADANVSLRPGGETTLTGSDGMYEFKNLDDGDYKISVSKAEYTDLVDEFSIQIRNGCSIQRDLQIKKQLSDISITNVYGEEISYLDFGSDLYTTTKSFNIFNNGTANLNCSISYSCTWIRSVSSIPGTIVPGQNVSVSVEIDRSKLLNGNNTTMLYITSNNGNNCLAIRATGEENIPNVITLPITNPDGSLGPYMHVFHGEVVNVGYPAYRTRGFCWSTIHDTPNINVDESTIVPGNGIGEYSYDAIREIGDFFNMPTSPVVYYVRAWVKREDTNEIIYGNVQSFVFNDVK